MTGTRQSILVVITLALLPPCRPDACAQPAGTTPRRADLAQPKGEASWLRQVAEQQGVVTNSRYDVIFIGDSLTEFWTSIGKASWSGSFTPLTCANCGISGDRTEHILYRIERLDFRRAAPHIFVLLMGTNNLGMTEPDKPEDVVRAILGAATSLTKRHPRSRILILEIPPSGLEPGTPLRESIKRTNALLAKATLPARASLLSIHDAFLDPSGRWRGELTPDGTHFSAAGYATLAELLAPKLKELADAK